MIVSIILALVGIVFTFGFAFKGNFLEASINFFLHWIASGIFIIAYEINSIKQKHL